MSLKVNIKKRLGNFNLDVAFETVVILLLSMGIYTVCL